MIQKYKFSMAVFGLGLAIGILGWFLYATNPVSPQVKPVTSTPKIDFEILYTNEGYVPNILEIPLGSTVAFKNTADFPMWTASDPHPVHSDFSDFDSKKEFFKNEFYAFKFEKSGTFSFHNHDKSIHRGVIRVKEKDGTLPNIDKTKQSQKATRDKLLALLDEKNPDTIFKMIAAIEGNPSLSRDCHDISHDLGHKSYELFGFSTAMTFNNPERLGHVSVDDICAGGYMHGIMEELFLHQPEVKDQLNIICASIPIANRDSCFHGIGHSLMFVHKRDVAQSLAGCRSIDNVIYTRRCFEGVWMEMYWGDIGHSGADSLGWDPEKPLEPCLKAQEDEKPDCFLYAHLGYLRTHPKDFEGVIKLCTQSGLDKWNTRYCLRGVGITMMKHFTSSKLQLTESLVYGLKYGEKYAYYEGVIGYSRLSGLGKKTLEGFCKMLITDQEVCLDVLNGV